MSLSVEVLQELFSDNPSLTDIYLFKITHKDLSTPVYLCNDKVSHTIDGITYNATSFAFTPPDKAQNDNDNGTEGSLSMTIVDQTIPDTLVDLQEYPSITCTGILITASGAVEEVESWDFMLKSASWTGMTLTATLTFETFLDTTVPGNTFDSTLCPGSWI
jgi:hypothetical protein